MFDIDITKNEKKQEQITVQYILRIFPQTYLIHKHLLLF